MSESNPSDDIRWSSRWLFVLAAAGSAVGLGNIWKFPYVAGENGGGAFVLIYLVCVGLVGASETGIPVTASYLRPLIVTVLCGDIPICCSSQCFLAYRKHQLLASDAHR